MLKRSFWNWGEGVTHQFFPTLHRQIHDRAPPRSGKPKSARSPGGSQGKGEGGKERGPPIRPIPDPTGPAHNGVAAVGGSASAAADDLVNAFLVDGSVAFLRGCRPGTGRGRQRERQRLSRHGGQVQPCAQRQPSPGHPHPHPHPHPPQASAQGFISPPPASSSMRGLGSTEQGMGQSKGCGKQRRLNDSWAGVGGVGVGRREDI